MMIAVKSSNIIITTTIIRSVDDDASSEETVGCTDGGAHTIPSTDSHTVKQNMQQSKLLFSTLTGRFTQVIEQWSYTVCQ